ncbi:acyltransferase family protein [Collimonas pratensis]|uniref:Acyltransferase family protein n=2 Tax=Collimonas pratensis TaxID=279113 RepID=A0A127Q6K6_9BURK|nr:acyltransferase family protein [Collimonas pratensis]
MFCGNISNLLAAHSLRLRPTSQRQATMPPITASPVRSDRNNGLDTLRAAAIILVFMYHYMCFVSQEATFGWASKVGWVGVDLFFVLSGYLISNQIFGGIVRGQELSLKNFYIRRFLRTLPNYYVVLALYFLFPLAMGGNTPPPLWRFLTFTQNLWLQPGTAFSHAWSLCIEEQFYLLLPAVVILAVRYGRSIRLAWVALLVLMLAGMTLRSLLWLQYGREAGGAIGGYYPNVYYSSFCRFDEFLPGIAVALLKNFHPDAWQKILRRGQVLLLAGTAATALMFYLAVNYYVIDGYGYGYFMSGFGYSLLALAFALLVAAALSPVSFLQRWRIPGAAQLAAWSYAIYLVHKPLAMIVHKLLRGAGINGLAEASLIIVLSIGAGWLLYLLVERPFMKLRDARYPHNFTAGSVPSLAAKAAA